MLRHRIAVKITFFVNGFILANWVARLPRIQELYGADNGDIGLVLFSLSIGAVAAMPFAGWVIIKNGSRSISLLTAILYSAVVPLIPLMPNFAALVALYFCIGVITGMYDVAINAQAVMVEREYKRPIMTSFHAFFSLGMMLGAWSAALFTDIRVDLESHFLIVAGVSLAAVAWASRNLIHDKPDPGAHTDGPLFRLPNASLISVGVIAFCCMMGEGAMSEWTVNFMENIARSTKALAPIALSAFATAMTLGRFFGDGARATFGDRTMIILGGILAFAGLSLALVIPLPYVSIAGFFLVGLGLSTIVPIAYSIAGNTRELPSSVALAMVTTVGYSGFLIGPPVIGFIADAHTLRVALTVVAALFIVMTVLGIRYKSK
ncbi:MFS transporter [Chryseolinea soli]|uniref:MFS transporter n=1 Tax=Chryseolinea soli TaxID=2321403 RepID=UPI00135AB862|nr:MFS transporter [Chryseolinea soli]